MQWLIDICQEWCQAQGFLTQAMVDAQGYLTRGMVDRGEAASVDFTVVDWTRDNTWREKDLSGILPEGVKGFSAAVNVRNDKVNEVAQFRMHGNATVQNISKIQTQVGHVSNLQDITQVVADSRIMEYKITPLGWQTINFTVKCWWF